MFKFVILALCLALANAGIVPAVTTYAAAPLAYSAGYHAPLAYSSYGTYGAGYGTYGAGYAAPLAYSSGYVRAAPYAYYR